MFSNKWGEDLDSVTVTTFACTQIFFALILKNTICDSAFSMANQNILHFSWFTCSCLHIQITVIESSLSCFFCFCFFSLLHYKTAGMLLQLCTLAATRFQPWLSHYRYENESVSCFNMKTMYYLHGENVKLVLNLINVWFLENGTFAQIDDVLFHAWFDTWWDSAALKPNRPSWVYRHWSSFISMVWQKYASIQNKALQYAFFSQLCMRQHWSV